MLAALLNWLKGFRGRVFPTVPRIALTATADPRTREEIATELCLAHARPFVASFDRPNIRYTIAETAGGGGRQRLLQFIEAEHKTDSGIVYCLSRRATEETAAWLILTCVLTHSLTHSIA